MSPKSRPTPLYAVSRYYSDTRPTVPRHQAIPGYGSSSFSSVSQDASIIDSHFSLSSTTSGPRHRPEPSQWDVVSRSPPQPGNFMATGYNAMNGTESYNSISMMTSDDMDGVYDFDATNALPRHAPMSSMDQTQVVTQDFMMQDYIAGMDFTPCSTGMDPSSMVTADPWTAGFRPPSPPDEEEIARQLQQSRHGLLPQETIGCEPLDYSKIQPYSASRHSAVQPRPIRPQSHRSESQQSSRHAPSPPSPPEDSADKTRARKDPLYDAPYDKDGYFRCPLSEQFGCSHKPTKQRCIYAKYLDSHLRPYKCRYAGPKSDCADARFSSNACLFRHEREAHGKHGHGDNPFLCKYANCPRAKPDNGFPRSWNQKDHMKRVHQWHPETDDEEQSHGRHAPELKRRKGGNAPASVQMKRSDSSYYGRAAAAPYTQDSRHAMISSRHQAATYNPMQTGNMMAYAMSMDDIQYSQYQTPSYYSGYSQAVY